MRKEELVALGLDETQINEVFKIRGKEIEESKVTLSTLQADKELAEKTLADLQKDIETKYVAPEAVETLKSEKTALETQIAKLVEDHNEEIFGIQYNGALDSELTKAGAVNLKFAKEILNVDNIKFEDGKLNGLEDELKAARENHAYLFAQDAINTDKPKFTDKQRDTGSGKLDAFAQAANRIVGIK